MLFEFEGPFWWKIELKLYFKKVKINCQNNYKKKFLKKGEKKNGHFYEKTVFDLRARRTRMCCLHILHMYDIHKIRLRDLSRTRSILVLEQI